MFSAQVSLVRSALARIVSSVAKLSVPRGTRGPAHAVDVAAAAGSAGALIQIQFLKQELLTY
jgi:hypothetical protein